MKQVAITCSHVFVDSGNKISSPSSTISVQLVRCFDILTLRRETNRIPVTSSRWPGWGSVGYRSLARWAFGLSATPSWESDYDDGNARLFWRECVASLAWWIGHQSKPGQLEYLQFPFPRPPSGFAPHPSHRTFILLLTA